MQRLRRMFMLLKYFKIFKTEECPCGSGLKYMNCCLHRHDIDVNIDHLNKIALDIAKKFDNCKYEVCLHPAQSECKPPIKAAHAIQNHGTLSLISVDNHVIGFRSDKTTPLKLLENNNNEVVFQRMPESIGVNEATVNTCFCNYHDSVVFRPIECNPEGYNPGSEEQLFLYAYKAFAFEYYKSKVAIKAQNELFKMMPQKFKKYPFLFVPTYRQSQLKEIEMEYYKSFFDKALNIKDYNNIVHHVIKIPFRIKFSSVDCLSPNYDIHGKTIKNKSKGLLKRLFLTILPDTSNSYIMISYLENDRKCFDSYAQSLKNASQEDLFEYLSTILPLYSENIILSPQLWDSWGEAGQYIYSELCNLVDKELFIYDKTYSYGLKNKYKQGLEIPSIACNLFI